MRSKGSRTIKLNPVDEDHQIHDHPARANLEALMDQKLFAQRIRSERASAYWFAASMWGVTGLVLGGILGASHDVRGDGFFAAVGIGSGDARNGGRTGAAERGSSRADAQ